MNIPSVIFILIGIISIVNSDNLKCSVLQEHRIGRNFMTQATFFKCKEIKSSELQVKFIEFFLFKEKSLSSNLFLENVDFGTEESEEVHLSNGWFTADLLVRALIFKFSNFNRIEADAFNSRNFEKLYYLELSAVPIEVISQDTFNGLNYLAILQLQGTKVHRFDGKPLSSLPSLEFFGMFSCPNKEINIDSLFGSTLLPKLDCVWIIKCNLKRSITQSTFSSLINVTDLRLNANVIEEIGANSFDAALKNLKHLELMKNNLKTIPGGLFKTQQQLEIDISSNPWTCDCDADQIQEFVDQTPNVKFRGNTCDTPDLTCYPMSTEPDGVEGPPKDEIKQKVDFLTMHCERNRNEKLNFFTAASENLPSIYYEGEQIFVDASDLPPVFDMIEFEESDGKKPALNCIAHRKGDARRVDMTSNLATNQMFRFCLVEKDEEVTSHCVAIFFHLKVTDADLTWVKDLILMIISLFLSSLFGLAVGMVVAFVIIKKYPYFIGKIE